MDLDNALRFLLQFKQAGPLYSRGHEALFRLLAESDKTGFWWEHFGQLLGESFDALCRVHGEKLHEHWLWRNAADKTALDVINSHKLHPRWFWNEPGSSVHKASPVFSFEIETQYQNHLAGRPRLRLNWFGRHHNSSMCFDTMTVVCETCHKHPVIELQREQEI